MAEDVQGLIVLTEGDRFVSIGRAGRARVWRVDLSGEPVDDVDRTGAAPDLKPSKRPGWHRDGPDLWRDGLLVCGSHSPVQHRDGRPPWCPRCGRLADGVHNREWVGGVLHPPASPVQHVTRVEDGENPSSGASGVCTCGMSSGPTTYTAAAQWAVNHKREAGRG